MASKASRKDKLTRQVEVAEEKLVLRQFKEAETVSLDLLRGALYVPDSSDEQQRAAFVLVQALYELQRFEESLAVLEDHYGGTSTIGFDVLMLWVALALDARRPQEAAAVLGNYITARTVAGSQTSLTAEQRASAVWMYAIEVLARESGQMAEAEAWLHSHRNLLTPDQLQRNLSALAELQRADQADRPDLAGRPTQTPDLLQGGSSPAEMQPAGAAAARSAQQTQTTVTSSQSSTVAPSSDKGLEGPGMENRAQHDSQATCVAIPTTLGSAADSIRLPVALQTADASSTGRDEAAQDSWYSRVSQQLSAWWQQAEQGEGISLLQPQVGAAAVGGAVLLYALLAERGTILTGARRVGGGLLAGIADVARMAFQLNPNPVPHLH